uniref:Uncharacterized protein n=1 Tax=Neobodo designis TaxID=312471 RepID=A0A7S1MFY7_NEODS|mmetsp:Transcript_39980/g.123520  ORF Transcript_39980/g.123520 Transcript_39980/m.123520 type:complete len:514 (+) Transcript_39980:35-1576(+)
MPSKASDAGSDALVARIAELQTVRDELVDANDALIAAVGDMRKELASRADAGHASPQHGAAENGVGSRFARFVGDMVEKRHGEDTKADASRAAVDRGDAAALAASQLNVRLLQDALRKAQSSSAVGAVNSPRKETAATVPQCGECEAAARSAKASQEKCSQLEELLAAKVADFNDKIAHLTDSKHQADRTIEELVEKCRSLQQALEETAARERADTSPKPAPKSADDDFNFDEFDAPAATQETPPTRSPVGASEGDASRELLQVAFAEVKAQKATVESLRQELADMHAAAENSAAKHAEELALAEEQVSEANRSVAAQQDVAASLRSELEDARRSLTEAAEHVERLESDHAQRLRQKDSALKELRAMLARAEKSGTPPPLSASHSRAPSVSTTAITVSTQTAPVHADPTVGACNGETHTPKPLPAPAGSAAAATAPTQQQHPGTSPSKGTFGRFRGLFGGGASKSSATTAAELKSAPVQKLRSLLEETLQENMQLQARVAELERVSSSERLRL